MNKIKKNKMIVFHLYLKKSMRVNIISLKKIKNKNIDSQSI